MRLLPLLLVLIALHASAQPTFVWWEGEDPAQTNFPDRSWFSPDTDGDFSVLSGGSWLSSSGEAGRDIPSATYRIAVPEAGAYHFWVRKYWKHGPFHWRFGDQPWQTVGRDISLAGSQPIREHVTASWTYVGQIELPQGPTTFDIKLAIQPGEQSTAGFDCFVLSREPFIPKGKLQPGQGLTDAEPGWFAFDPPLDGFRDSALLDLRHLNESEAGVNGPLQRSTDGNDILLGDGTPVRFWGVNLSHNQSSQPDFLVDYMAAKLAKLGVNMARHHGGVWVGDGNTTLSDRKLERLHYLVSSFKKQGIYTNISWYFPLWVKSGRDLGLDGYRDDQKPFAVLFFSDKAQQHYLDLLRQFMSAKNPYTGVSLAHDPAVGMIELLNEDSLFFWTFTKRAVPPEQWAILEMKFGQYLAQKYGSLDKAFKQWPGAKLDSDDRTGVRAGVYEAWHMTGDAQGKIGQDEKKRVADQVAFFAQLQHDFYARAAAMLRDELGYKGLISASNWHTADPALTDAVERWSYTAVDVIDQHGYFNPANHEGDGSGYSVRVGHTYQDRSGLKTPEKLPLRFNQVDGHPQIISELGWTNPNRYRADSTLLTAATAALQGIDGTFLFAVNSDTMVDNTITKFQLCSPVIVGGFPAAALMYRRGDLETAPVAVHEALRTDDLFALKGTAAVTEAAYDAFRAVDVPPGATMSGDVDQFDPYTAYVGRVTRSFDKPGDKDTQLNLAEAIDRKRKRLTSLNDSFVWDYGRGVVTVDTDNTKAVAGFLQEQGTLVFDNVQIHSDNHYGQVFVTALDDQPLITSRKILVQSVTEEQFYGWKSAGGKVLSLGQPPWNLKPVKTTVDLHVGDLPIKRAVALDFNGQAAGEVEAIETVAVEDAEPGDLISPTTWQRVSLPAEHLYTIIER